jgi:RNA polymerase sigma-70 factor, ECF subfamily
MAETDPSEQLDRLMRAALAGDQAAYRAFLMEAAKRLRAFLRRRLPSGSLADLEDLVQETLLAIHAKRHTFDPGEPVGPWLYAIARYRMIDMIRRRRTEGVRVDLDDIAELPADGDPQEATASLDLDRLIRTLPPQMRIPIELTKLEGMSVQDAATRAGMSVSAIKVGVHRGLKRLARLVRTQEG